MEEEGRRRNKREGGRRLEEGGRMKEGRRKEVGRRRRLRMRMNKMEQDKGWREVEDS